SRQPTWDMACTLQADMFREAEALGSLDIRLVYYRGFNECRASAWISDSAQLARLMNKIDCREGHTQIGKVLSDVRRESATSAVRAVVFVGDAMEEPIERLCRMAGELGLLRVPVFMFQEGHDDVAEPAFQEIARLTGGAWCRFDPGAAVQLRELLRAAAAYAAGGREALLRLSKAGGGAAKLIGQMK
ncbi:MAG: VWA domain-containing protein, partial [Bradyrhizobium sp.]|nr:VWA domain-containing protein [Bradyrhizobium sp.]